jgi:hypothetical protein
MSSRNKIASNISGIESASSCDDIEDIEAVGVYTRFLKIREKRVAEKGYRIQYEQSKYD